MAKYKDLASIGSGGFGEVFECERDTDGQRFAKKRLLATADDDAASRFKREARILSKLDHPNVIRVVATQLVSLPYWFVMPRYQHSLDEILHDVFGDHDRIGKIFGALLNAVEYAHSEGVIHRDLKPANVLMHNDDDLVVSDFGLGRMLSSTSTRNTMTGMGLGSLVYMAPEQIQDAKRADERADVYALGRMLYELYTERISIGQQDLDALPPAVALIVGKCTQPVVTRRFQSVAELKRNWQTLVDSADDAASMGELATLRTRLTFGPVPPADANRFFVLIARVQHDSDLIHETIMKMHPTGAAALFDANPEHLRRLIREFTTHASSQGWGFSYTDQIADQCSLLYHALSDVAIRARLISCLAEVGVSHNRWHVLNVFVGLVREVRDGAEALAIIAEFQGSRRHADATERLAGIALQPALQGFFK